MPQANRESHSLRRRKTIENDDDGPTMGALERAVTCAGGLLATALILFVFYRDLAAAAKPLHPLSSTAIVTVGITLWVVAWFCLVVVILEWQSE